MRVHIAIALTALCVVDVSSKYENGRGIIDMLNIGSYPDTQPGHVPARSSVEPVGGEFLQEEGRRKTGSDREGHAVVIHNQNNKRNALGVEPTALPATPGLFPNFNLKSSLSSLGNAFNGIGGNKGGLGTIGTGGVGGGLGAGVGAGVGGGAGGGTGWGLGWISDVMKGPSWGWGGGSGAGLPALPTLGQGVAAGPGTGIGNTPGVGSILGNKGSSAGTGLNNGIVSVSYGKPPPQHYETHAPGIFNPFAGWLSPENGLGNLKGGARPATPAGPSTSEVLVVRYPEFIRTIGRGISRMTNSLRNLGEGFSNSLTQGISDASAGIGSGVYSIISLNDDDTGNVGNLNNKGQGLGAGSGPQIVGGGGGPGGGGVGSSTVYVDKHPTVGLGGGNQGSSWFPNPSSWFGSTYIDPDTTSTVYVDKGSQIINRNIHRH